MKVKSMGKIWLNVLVFPQVSTLVSALGVSLTAICDILEGFETRDVKWSPDGKGFILLNKGTFCCGFEVE